MDLSEVETKSITSDQNKFHIEFREDEGFNEETRSGSLEFTFDLTLEKGIQVRLKLSGSATSKMEIVRCAYLGIKSDKEMESFDMEDELVNWPELENGERLRKYLEGNVVPLVIKKIKYTKFSPQFNIFLSHKSKDKKLMKSFRNAFKFLGYKTWLDEDNLPIAADLLGALKIAVEECHCLLVWLNEEYFQSDYCKAELLYAKKLGKIIIPFGDHGKVIDHLKGEFEFLAHRFICDTSKRSFFEVLRRIDDALFDFEKLPI